MAQWRCLLLLGGRSPCVCVRGTCAYQWIRSVGRDAQSPPRTAPLAYQTNCGHVRNRCRCWRSASTSRLQPFSIASCPRTPVVHPATAAEGPLPGIQQHCEPKRGRSGLYATPAVHHRGRRTSTSPALSPQKTRFSMRRDGPGNADVVQRRHPSLQQPLGLTSRHSEEKGRQPAVLCGLQATQCGDCERRAPHSSHRWPPWRTPWSPPVFHSWPQERILAGPNPGTGQGEDGLPHQQRSIIWV